MAAVKTTKPSLSLAGVEKKYATEDACKALLTQLRWPDGKVACVRCGATERVYALKARPFHWVCKNVECGKANGYRFSVLTGSVFESSNMPLVTWFRVAFLMVSSKKGISAMQVHRMIAPAYGKRGSYKTAWYMCHRLRAAMNDGTFPLSGTVEIDETYVGGKDRNRHKHKKSGGAGGFGSGKVGVIGAISRKGNVVCQVIERLDQRTVDSFVEKAVSSDVSIVATDDCPRYEYIDYGPHAKHESVNHSDGEYVRGNIHTANIDSFWSLLKRGVVGTFHKVSKTHLPLYLNEFSWRYNHRNDDNIFHAVLAGC